ncbi:DUF6299 family protein [Streptomyces sp. NPDC048507]|uniref:DUF6299 family protein n=1 Tax=Streptomyces sp. NPDC048507 TaxID=3365560 RepID=UPI003722C8F2
MPVPGVRTAPAALAVLAALAAVAALPAPARAARGGDTIAVAPRALLTPDGRVHLFGTYRCTGPSATGALQISVKIVQGDFQLGTSGGDALCDGAEHAWESHSGLTVFPNLHEGPATTEARLQGAALPGIQAGPAAAAFERRSVEVVARHG